MCCLNVCEDFGFFGGVSCGKDERVGSAGVFANCPAAPVVTRCPALPFLVWIFPCHTAWDTWSHHAEEAKLKIVA